MTDEISKKQASLNLAVQIFLFLYLLLWILAAAWQLLQVQSELMVDTLLINPTCM